MAFLYLLEIANFIVLYQTMVLSYDYGDGWEIKLTLERIYEDKELPGKELPRVLDGDGYGIIEDCGGTGGLEELAKVFKQKKGSRYKELSAWLGTDSLDLTAFDIDDMNYRLKKVPRIYSDIYEYGIQRRFSEYLDKLPEYLHVADEMFKPQS